MPPTSTNPAASRSRPVATSHERMAKGPRLAAARILWVACASRVRSVDKRMGAGMCQVVHFAQTFARNVGIDLRRRNVGVSQEIFDGSEVARLIQHICREAMAQGVRTDALYTGL